MFSLSQLLLALVTGLSLLAVAKVLPTHPYPYPYPKRTCTRCLYAMPRWS